MTRNYLLIIALSLHSFLSYSQQTINIPLEKGETILDFIELPENGFILKTGKNGYYTKDLSWKLSFYTKDLQKNWAVNIEAQQMNKNHGEDLVASPSGNYVYHIENTDNNITMGTSSYKISQVNERGEVKLLELKVKDVYEYNSQIKMLYLCDEEYFYIVSTEEQTQKYSPKLHFYKINHSSLQSFKVQIDLPALSSDKNQWEYAGHDNEFIWLAAVEIDKKHESFQTKIISVNWNGQSNKIETTLESQLSALFPINSENIIYNSSSKIFRKSGLKSLGSWSQALVDHKNKMIYSFGFYNPKPTNGFAASVRGYYVFAYNLNGHLLWKHISDQSDIMLKEKLFNRPLALPQRNIFAYLTSDNGLRIQLPSYENICTYNFSKTGDKTQTVNSFEESPLEFVGNKTFMLRKEYFFLCAPASTPFSQYYKTNYHKKKTFYATTQPLGHILIESKEGEEAKILKW